MVNSELSSSVIRLLPVTKLAQETVQDTEVYIIYNKCLKENRALDFQ